MIATGVAALLTTKVSETVNTREQGQQESEYWFPYHYIAAFDPGFSQCVSDDWAINYASTIEMLLDRLDRIDFASIIDVGCGDGRFTREIAIRFPSTNVTGIDYSTRAIGLAAAMNSDLPGIEFVARDITNDESTEPSDVVVLMEVLEHIPVETAPVFMRAIRRLLRPGGTLLLTVPHANKPVEMKHFRHFSVDTITEALREEFEKLEVVPFERQAPSRRLIDALLNNGIFSLQHKPALNWIYRYYKRHLLHCTSERECQRLLVIARVPT